MPTNQYPVDLRNPQISANPGNSFFTVAALTAWDFGHYEFIHAVNGNVFGVVVVPSTLVTPSNARIVIQCAANATTGNTVLQVATKPVALSASINPASLTAEPLQIIGVPVVAYERFDVTFTLTPTVNAGDLVIVQVYHNGASVNETLAANLLLLGAYLLIDSV